MKIYVTLWLILIALYGVFHFGFRETGANRLYRINDRIAFELRTEAEFVNGVSVRGYHRTNVIVRLLCGGCAVNYDEVDMPSAKYIKGDYVYTDNRGHATALTDIVNLSTGEAIDVVVPGDPATVDLATLPEYAKHALVADEQYKLRQDYIKANFEPLSTYSGTCIWIHLGFGILALFLIFPSIFRAVIEALASDDDTYTDIT